MKKEEEEAPLITNRGLLTAEILDEDSDEEYMYMR
jgi:hypothetical protein